MHVLHVISSLDPRGGGPVAALSGLASAQLDAGMTVSVAATYRQEAEQAVANRLRDLGVRMHLIGPTMTPLMWHPRLAATLRHAMDNADVVHIHAMWEEIQHRACRLARQRRMPYIMRPCGMLDPWSLAQSSLKKRVYMRWRLNRNLREASAIHYTTPQERDLAGSLNIPAPAVVEPLGVDLSEFETLPDPDAARAKYPQLADRPVMAFLGRVYPGKGLEHLIPAMAQMTRTDAMLLVVGPDNTGYQQELTAMAEAHGVSDRIIFAGLLNGRDRIEALVDATLFTLPSDHENFGIAVVEALAAGTPAVISEEVAIAGELEEAGVCGVSPREPGALAATLDQWLNDDMMRQEAADRARPFVRSRYNWSQIARNWQQHYERLLDGSTPAAVEAPVP